MGLFDESCKAEIEAIAAKSKQMNPVVNKSNRKINSIVAELDAISEEVKSYFHDSPAILITNKQMLKEYVDKLIDVGIAGIDTETTGLDRINDYVVGASLYYPGGIECYIPMKHKVPIFDTWYPNQLSYEDVSEQLQRIVDAKVKLVFANADFDLSMIYHSLNVDLCPVFHYDVILAWRCIQEDERDNSLKGLYAKYVLGGKGDPKKFSDFFSPEQFPYCNPNVAKLYAANDAKITYDLYEYQSQFVDKSVCSDRYMPRISELISQVEFPLVKVCQTLHRTGIYFDSTISKILVERYHKQLVDAEAKLKCLIDELVRDSDVFHSKKVTPFTSGADFNPKSILHMRFLIYDLLKRPVGKDGSKSADKSVLSEMNTPITNQILKARSLLTLISTFVDKLPNSVADDGRIHASFKQLGASCVTGDSIVPTKYGWYSIKEIYDSIGDSADGEHLNVEDLYIINKNQEYEKCESIVRYKNVDTIKITTDFGLTIEGTPNHPIMVSSYSACDGKVLRYDNDKFLSHIWDNREFKVLSDIRVGDIVEIPCQYETMCAYQDTNIIVTDKYNSAKPNVTFPDILNEELGLFLGMYHADGDAREYCGGYMIRISNDNEDVINATLKLGMNLFNIKGKYCKDARHGGGSTYITSKRIIGIEELLSHGASNKYIPNKILISPNAVINAYLKGMTLDSTVVKQDKGAVTFEMSVAKLDDAKFIQSYLISQGILCGIRIRRGTTFDGYRLKFNSDNYIRFRDSIGFVESNKYVDAVPCRQNAYERRRIDNSFRVKVKFIEYKKSDVYDFHVPDTHSFVVNGMISHNTGRMSSESPNLQNIPSHATDIRHLFRATPGYVMLSSDYSAQEPRITAYVSQDPKMIKTFQEGKDIYANIASLSFGLPYEECLEFHPETGEYQPDGKKRRSEAKSVVLGICYGRSIPSIAEQLYGKDDSLSQDDRNKKAQAVYDGVLNAFPNLRKLMISTDKFVREHGYVETILGRRRHIPEMLLPEFEFYAKEGYINPEVDPLDVSTLNNTNEIPQRMKDALLKEFKGYKYYGQIVKRTKELDEQHIRVVNNRHKISEASRQIVNSVIQGSAADQTKLAMLVLTNNEDWKRIGGRLLVPVHDELIAEVPMEHWEEGGKILSSCMIQAAKFLPFDSKCDVTTTLRWYGLEYPCRYQKPISYDTIEPEEIKWIQYQLVEMEYILPVIVDGDEKPRGDAAVGINGKITQEYKDAIDNYIETRNILKDNFVETIEHEVLYGEVKAL